MAVVRPTTHLLTSTTTKLSSVLTPHYLIFVYNEDGRHRNFSITTIILKDRVVISGRGNINCSCKCFCQSNVVLHLANGSLEIAAAGQQLRVATARR
jgi:hypothetical protein